MSTGKTDPAVKPFRRFDRIGVAAAVVAIHVLMGFAFGLGMKIALPLPARGDRPTLILIEPTPPPPPESPPRRVRPEPAAKGGSSPARKAPPLPTLAPAPLPTLPIPPPLIVATPPVASSGGAGEEGTSGGAGDGIGAGGAGSGTGEGAGDGEDFSEARQIRGRFRNSDFPASARSAGRVKIGVRYAVGPTGRVDQCEIIESSGYPEVDAMTCRVIVDRYRFKPARDGQGTAVTEVMEERYTWTME